MPHPPVIDIAGLAKRFGTTHALEHLDLRVEPGEIAGFLGPNGAGKSTTIRVLLGLYRADAGSVKLFGADPWQEAVALHRRLAYVPGDVGLWPNLTGGETIDLLGRLRGGLDAGRRDALIQRFELDPTRKVRAYSKGNRQKVALVAALAAETELLVLDEPSSGLDPLMEEIFIEEVRSRAAAGTAVLLSSHILSQVEQLCETVTIIRRGRTVRSGRLSELQRLARPTITVETVYDAAALAALPGVHGLSRTGEAVRFTVDPDSLDAVMREVAALGVRSLVSAPPSLEQLFLREYESPVAVQTRHGRHRK